MRSIGSFGTLRIHDVREIARRRLEVQLRIKFNPQALCEPGIEKFVAAPEGDSTRSNDGDDFVLANASQKVIPEGIV